MKLLWAMLIVSVLSMAGCGGGSMSPSGVFAPGLKSLSVSPFNPGVLIGTGIQFHLTGIYLDGTSRDVTGEASWSIQSDATTATITQSGLAKCDAAGQAEVAANFDGQSANTTLTCTDGPIQSISVTPASSSIHVGTTEQFKATAIFADGTSHDITSSATWDTSAPIATIDSDGLATCSQNGVTQISATSSTLSGSAQLTCGP